MKRACVLLLLLTGCTFHHQPFIAYEGQVPLSQTAIFLAEEPPASDLPQARVKRVDGKDTDCYQAGCPYWVRVLPGSHSFLVQVMSSSRMSAAGIVTNSVDAEVRVPDMKPRHVYTARYGLSGNKVSAVIKDLGENPDIGVNLGLGTVHRTSFAESKP